MIFPTGSQETGWRDVVRGELINADLDRVTLQIRTHNDKDKKVGLSVKDTNGQEQTYFKWYTKPDETLQLVAGCSPLNDMSPIPQVISSLAISSVVLEKKV